MNTLFKKIMFVFLFVMMSTFGMSGVYAQNKNIEVTDITVKDKSGTITVEDPTISNGEINSGIKFNEINDFVTFELTLKNNDSDKYKITSITDNNDNDNIEIEYTYGKDYIEKDKTAKVTIKMTYKKKLINQDKISLNDLSIKLGFEKEDGSISEMIINPKTGDNILKYIALFITSGLGLFFILTKKRIKGFKIGNLLLIISIMLIPFAAFANEKYELSIKFSDIEVKGEFEIYNITIDPKDGSPVITKDITYGDPIGELPETSKEGYEFVKWKDEKGNEITKDTIITKPIEVEAVFKAKEYDITYNLNGGKISSEKTNPNKYTIESDDITLNNPEKAGYTFSGWTGTDIDTQTTSVTISKGSTGSRNYVANYSVNQDTVYTVIHKYRKLNSNEYDVEEKEEHGATDTEVSAPIKHKDGFVDPASKNVTIKGDGSAEVIYEYEREVYDFSITDRNYINNASTANGEYQYEAEITVKALERAGYTFKWSDNETDYERTFSIDKDIQLTPIYTANTNTQYKVIHKKQNVTLNGYEVADTQNLTGTTDTEINPAVNTYYGFISPSAQTTTIKGDGTTEVIYEYNRDSYTVTFDTDNGTAISDQTIKYEAKASRPSITPTKEHYTFDDWYTDDTYETKFDFTNTKIEEDTTIYAKYNPNKYTVSFNTNGGTEIESQEVEYGKKATRPENNPELFNREFVDWYTDDTYETKYNFDTMTISGNTTIYAKYNDLCNGFSTDSWSTIKTNVENNPKHYPVGCKKEVSLDMDNDNTPEIYKVRIANTNMPAVCRQEGYSQTACGVVIEFADVISKRRMNSTQTTDGGWKETEMVTYLNSEFYNNLPNDLQDSIIPTYPIVSGSGTGLSSENITEEDTDKNKIYFFSTREVGLGGQYDNKANVDTDTRVLDYYTGTESNGADSKRIKYNVGTNVYAQNWLLRTASSHETDKFLAVSSAGELGITGAGDNHFYNYYMAPAFRIADAPKYTVEFNANGGTGTMTNQAIYSGVSTKLNANAFTPPTDMIFNSWNTKQDGSGTTYTNKESINLEKSNGESITLYAQWEPAIQTWTQNKMSVTDGYRTFEVGDAVTGYSVTVDNETYADGDWYVLGAEDGKLLLSLKQGKGKKTYVGGQNGWPHFPEKLDTISASFKNSTFAQSARSINLNDINKISGFEPYEYEEVTYTNDNGVIRTADTPTGTNFNYSSQLNYYDSTTDEWKLLGNGQSMNFKSSCYEYKPEDFNILEGSKTYDLLFKDQRNIMVDGKVTRLNQYWLADKCLDLSPGQGYIAYRIQTVELKEVRKRDSIYNSNVSNNDPNEEGISLYVKPVVVLKQNVRVNASGKITN